MEHKSKLLCERQHWMSVLSRATSAELDQLVLQAGGLPDYAIVKSPEVGSIMVEGRAGGTGVRFNLGEVTVTRAIVQLGDGTLGYSYSLGRDKSKAEKAAVLDACLQNEALRSELLEKIIRPLARLQAERREVASRQAAATKVNFFTLLRGDG